MQAREPYLVVRDRRRREEPLVAAIEPLSPTNKNTDELLRSRGLR